MGLHSPMVQRWDDGQGRLYCGQLPWRARSILQTQCASTCRGQGVAYHQAGLLAHCRTSKAFRQDQWVDEGRTWLAALREGRLAL